MEKIDYGFYDSIDNTATRWLAWNQEKNGKIGFACISANDEKHLWLLCMARNLYTYNEKPIYIDTSVIEYLWLRFVKKFRFLRRYRARKNKEIYSIDAIVFIEEVCKACNIVPEMIAQIYEIYYKR